MNTSLTCFEIKVALLGINDNADDVTRMFLKALLCKEKDIEIAHNNTPKVGTNNTILLVNHFHITTRTKSTDSVDEGIRNKGEEEEMTVSIMDEPSNQRLKNSPTDTNCSFRKVAETASLSNNNNNNNNNQDSFDNSNIQEYVFDIEMEDLFCEMQKNTNLVITNITIRRQQELKNNDDNNNKSVHAKYIELVKETFHTYDCVILIINGKQGTVTKEQKTLLKLINDCNIIIKQIPVIILYNTAFDKEDDKKQSDNKIRENCLEVEHIFNFQYSESVLQELLSMKQQLTNNTFLFLLTENSPAFIPICLIIDAYIYRTVATSNMAFNEFSYTININLIEKLGQDLIWT